MIDVTGWLLDVYTDVKDGIIVWLLGEDGGRYRLQRLFPITFYAYAPFPELRCLWKYLRGQSWPVELARVQREDLYSGMLDVMAITVVNAVHFPLVLRRVQNQFPNVELFDADIPISVRFAAETAVFPLTKCRVTIDVNNTIRHIEALGNRWNLETAFPTIRLMTIEPDCEPFIVEPKTITVSYEGRSRAYPLKPIRHLLVLLQAAVKRYDPDLIVTKWGDTWLFPFLFEQAKQQRLPFHISRDEKQSFEWRGERSYTTYGQVIFRGQQTYLYGRWHIDQRNAMMFHEYRISGAVEQAHVSGMPVQEMARKSPGAGITALQMLVGLKRSVLVPHKRQQAEYFKSARQLINSDRGGMVYQPEIGVYTNVIEIDFVSMYPSIIANFNVSPETVMIASNSYAIVPELGIPIDLERDGLLPEVLRPLIAKRIAIKSLLATMNHQDCRYPILKARSNALKWLLVVAFGYARYKNAKYGRVETHEAITAYSREAMLRAKETAENLGYDLIHMYVDGLFVRPKNGNVGNVDQLLAEIQECTGLPIALEGIYKWVAFLPSRLNELVPVAHRYFGVFSDGAVKVRGIEARRRNTPKFIVQAQLETINQMAKAKNLIQMRRLLPQIIRRLQSCLANLRNGRIQLEQLIVSQTLGKPIEAYMVKSATLRAARQLTAVGKEVRPGQQVRFIYTRGQERVYAWGLPYLLHPTAVDVELYTTLLIRAISTILQPLGLGEAKLRDLILGNEIQLPLPLKHYSLQRLGSAF